MADNQNATNQKRIAELQKGEAEGRLTDEEAAELSRLQQETAADGTTTGGTTGGTNTGNTSNR